MINETILLVINYIYYCILLVIPIDVSNATASGLIDWINTSYKLHVPSIRTAGFQVQIELRTYRIRSKTQRHNVW